MYEQFYSLKENPFSLTPDPEFLFVSPDYQSALDKVLYGIGRREGFAVIVGDVGTGKTTLCWALLARLEKDLKTALILNPMLTAEDMLRAILQDFGVGTRRSGPVVPSSDHDDPAWMQEMTRKELVDELNLFLLEQARKDVFCVLIIDEAQDLSIEVLEQLRLLSNLETSKKKLLQIIFVGQIEFDEKLKAAELRSLNQRISTRYELKPLSERDTASYVAHRLKVAEANRNLEFTAGAMRGVYRYSRGYPRLVNLICDRSLLEGHSEKTWTITGRMVRKAAAGLRGRDGRGGLGWLRRIQTRGHVAVVTAVALLALAFTLGWRGVQRLAFKVPDAVPAPAQVVQAPAFTPVLAAQPAAVRPEPALPLAPAAARQGAAEAGRYHVQVHSFLIEAQAVSAARELERRGFAVEVRTIVRPTGTRWFVVVIGPFDDIESARECAADLRRTGGASPIIVRTGA